MSKVTWEFGPRAAKVGGVEFRLREGVGPQEIVQFAERLRQDSTVHTILKGAMEALAEGLGGFRHGLLERVRATVASADEARAALEQTSALFDTLFEPAGLEAAFSKEPKAYSAFIKEALVELTK